MDDRKLRESLTQHFGSRLAIRDKVRHVYGDGVGYDAITEGFDISLASLTNDEIKFMDALEFFNKPAKPEFIAGQIARLRVSLPRRAEENNDIELLVDVMLDDCSGYPADVIAHVAKQWRLENKWFPIPKDFRAKLDEAVAFRREVLKAFEKARNPLLAGAKKKAVEADPRFQQHWKELPKREWTRQHYEWAIGECEDMLALARQYPHAMNVSMWEEKIRELLSDAEKSFGEAA